MIRHSYVIHDIVSHGACIIITSIIVCEYTHVVQSLFQLEDKKYLMTSIDKCLEIKTKSQTY